MDKSGRLELEDNIKVPILFTDIISLYSTTETYLASKAIKFGEKRNIRAIIRRARSFKVTEVGSNRKRVCDFLLVINSN